MNSGRYRNRNPRDPSGGIQVDLGGTFRGGTAEAFRPWVMDFTELRGGMASFFRRGRLKPPTIYTYVYIYNYIHIYIDMINTCNIYIFKYTLYIYIYIVMCINMYTYYKELNDYF